ncbi:probable pyruvate, phosphate dikinase regulatory protein, chloroplastic [Rutidosis leptorrhynchoides]|uniref:probable pyruvate, phosphate dikinase regulatory protein, chloroplastic n=1 Tax=Rutidosis leptorrhynchoides TaxID=125765 RepID=UPI003A9A5B9C
MIPPITEPTSTGNPNTEQFPSSNGRKLGNISGQLNRWSRARVIRSGRKLDRPPVHHQTATQHVDQLPKEINVSITSPSSSSLSSLEDCTLKESDDDDLVAKGKEIYMVSDGSGRTAEHSVNAALGQFEHFMVHRGCSVNTRLFSGINDIERLMEIIMQAAKEDAILIYTLADEKMAASARHACKVWGVSSIDILRPIIDAIASHLGVSPSGLPRGAPGRKFPLTDDYFKRIDAIEFTIKQDDGALPQNLHRADIVIAGVSRSGKTPLSIYLAQKGFKVANVPIVVGIELPKSLYEIDPKKVFALTINPVMLQTIRRERAKSLGFVEDEKSSYAEMVHVREELDYATKIFVQNPTWPVIEVTGKAIEEIAVIVLRLYQDRKQNSSIPVISRIY